MIRFFTIFFLLISTIYADCSPQHRLEEVISRVKETKKLESILDFVYWPYHYAQLSKEQKLNMNVSSPKELKEFSETMFKDPVKNFQGLMDRLPKEQQIVLGAVLKTQLEGMLNKAKAQEAEIVKSNLSVKGEEIKANKAKVEVEKSLRGQKSYYDVNMVKFDDQWWLDASDLTNIGKGLFQ